MVREDKLNVFTGYVLKYRRLFESGRRILSGSGTGKERRPRNLVVCPELSDTGTGRRVVLIARRPEEGLMAAGGALMKAIREGGSLMILGFEGTTGPSQKVRRAFKDLDVADLRHDTIPEDGTGSLHSLLDDWSPEIVFAPSPVEDREVYRALARAYERPSRSNPNREILLYELRNPLLPNRLVDITGVMERKESLMEESGDIDLFLALNQYRSVTNMKGRGFAEAFYSIPADAGKEEPGIGSIDPDRLDVYPIPFFRGFDLLNGGKVARWEGEEPGRRILVLAPHFDDETIGCGGTLLRHHHRGDRTSVIFFTDGREGDPRESDPDLVSAVRRREAVEAASILGIGRTEFLDQPETRLRPVADLEKKVGELIDGIDPDVVYLPSFLENHVDHIELNRIFHRILKRSARSMEIRMFGLWTLIPSNLVVDIGGEIEEKIRGINAYRSQLTQVDYLSVTIALNRYWSMRYGDGGGYMESFHALGPAEYCSIIERLGIDREIY